MVSSMGYVVLSGKMQVDRQEMSFFTYALRRSSGTTLNSRHNSITFMFMMMLSL